MNEELENAKKLYEKSKNFSKSDAPKHTFFSVKCPKCDNKLKKKSIAQPVYAEEGGKEWGNTVVEEMNTSPGMYSLNIDQYACACGYEYVVCNLEEVDLSA